LSLLNRISSGLVFRDTFDSPELNSMWQISPSDDRRYSLTERPGVLRLKHGDPDLFCLMTSPQFDYVFEVDTDYQPIRASDQGGIVVYRDKDTRIELLEYYDPQVGASKGYNRLRMVKKSELYAGYGSDDNGKTWELIGTTFLSSPKIGIVLHGIQESQSDTLDVLEVRMYRDTTIQVGNLQEGLKVKLLDGAGVLIKEATCEKDRDHVKLDVFNCNFPLTGKLQLLDPTGLILAETDVINDLWGGDVFWYGIHLDLEIDGVLLREDREFFLGNMENGIIEKKAYVVNNHDIPIPNVRISVQAFAEYQGWEWVDIAQDLFGQPSIYKDTYFIGTMQPGDRVPFWMKVTKRAGSQMVSLSDYKFRILFESGVT